MSNRGYSMDLRKRVLDALSKGMTLEEAAEAFSIGVATAYRWQRLRRERGSAAPLPHGGGHPRAFDGAGDELLVKLVQEKSDRTIYELTQALNKSLPRPVSESAVGRALLRLDLSFKKRR